MLFHKLENFQILTFWLCFVFFEIVCYKMNELDTSFQKEIRTTEAFIDEQFTNHLKKDIMDEIKIFISKTVSNELELLKLSSDESLRGPEQSFHSEGKDFLKHLKREIDFLRKQVENRDDLIYALLQEKSIKTQNIQKYKNSDDFQFPKNPIKHSKSTQNEQISLDNRYDTLFIKENSSSFDDDINDIIIAPKQKGNVTTRKSRKNNSKKGDTDSNNGNNNKRVVAVVGDSIIKHVKGYQLTNKDNKVVVKTFPGAKTDCMKHYIIPTLKQKPDLVIIHCGTNDLKTKEPEEISKNVVALARSVNETNQNTGVIVSGIVQRGDDLNQKVMKVNEILEHQCNECNIGFLDNSGIDPGKHLNGSKLHLNVNGTDELQNNLKSIINC